MVLNTLTVGAAVTPTVTKTWVSHYTNRKPLRKKPTAHVSYHLGLRLVRRFVEYSALHTVEELQAFTGQWVPAPRWVKTEEIAIDEANIAKAAEYITQELGPSGIEAVGGKEWWRWRREDTPLKAEWIEMRKDYHERKAAGKNSDRVMLYVHGGAYYFGSVNEHRYQIQRHARKLKARCLAPRYRLAPQFPFPCGLHDCLAAYLYLLGRHDPSEIIVAGDSAGGGMVLALLVVLRDQGLPLPAGGILLSPWVDLTHSFPSILEDPQMDYIPGDGFMHKPSMGWPPPTADDVNDETRPDAGKENKSDAMEEKAPPTPGSVRSSDTAPVSAVDRKRGYSILNDPPHTAAAMHDTLSPTAATANGSAQPFPAAEKPVNGTLDAKTHLPAVMVDGKLIQIRDQIQMYAPNHLLFHPLVSPVLQPSLGGLPPILIQIGGGELLRDEQLYLAHKMANPASYPPRKAILDYYGGLDAVNKYKPTNVQVQLWEDMCHVGHTLSFTRPAKFMYRSVAQFGAWALAHAQGRAIDIPAEDSSDTDSVSSEEDEREGGDKKSRKRSLSRGRKVDAGSNGNLDGAPSVPVIKGPPMASVGKAGDPLPPFKDHMIRQRVDRHGDIYDMDAPEDIPALQLSPEEIGVLKEGPVKKWLTRQEKWNKRFASTKRDLQKKRAAQLAKGYVGLPEGEKPPPTALAGMRTKDLPKLEKIKTSWGMMMWSGWGSKHDQIRMKQDKEAEGSSTEEGTPTPDEAQDRAAPTDALSPTSPSALEPPRLSSRSRSRSRSVMDEGQANSSLQLPPTADGRPQTPTNLNLDAVPAGATVVGNTIIPASELTTTRPTAGGIAYPFKLKVKDAEEVRSGNASMMTLESEKRPMSVDGPATPAIETPGLATPGVATPVIVEGGEVEKLGERPPGPERFETAREIL